MAHVQQRLRQCNGPIRFVAKKLNLYVADRVRVQAQRTGASLKLFAAWQLKRTPRKRGWRHGPLLLFTKRSAASGVLAEPQSLEPLYSKYDGSFNAAVAQPWPCSIRPRQSRCR
jgi:hypothetical protein